MKKIVKITGAIILGILTVMFVIPLAFQDKIKEIIIVEGNKMLNAQFGFNDIDISLFREFPKASIGIQGFWLKGVDRFENDTLIYTEDVQVAVNLMSIFSNSGFEIG